MSPSTTQTVCPVCASDNLTEFFRSTVPVHVGILFDSAEEARTAPQGEIRLVHCDTCQLVHNSSFDPEKTSYQPGYDASLNHSGVFRIFLQEVAARLTDRYELHGKRIVEIGCGAGDFLRLLCKRGNEGIGFDPCVEAEGTFSVGAGSVRFVRDYYTREQAELAPHLVVCLSVFEDIPNPGHFLEELRQTITDENTALYFEVFNGGKALTSESTWSIHYEQCNYWTLDSLSNAFERHGFRILDAGTCYADGEYVYVEAAPTKDPSSETQIHPIDTSSFARARERETRRWTEELDRLDSRNERAVVWGTGGKGISFLTALPTAERIPYVVDINPNRQSRYTPVTSQRVVAPEFLTEYRPDLVIVSNPVYEAEIAAQLQELGVDCRMVCL